MAVGVPATSRKGWFGRRCCFLLFLCNRNTVLPRAKRSLLIAFVSLGRFLCSVKSFGPVGSVFYFCLLVSCLPLHTTRDGVVVFLIWMWTERLSTCLKDD